MKILTKKTDYAARALVSIAGRDADGFVPASRIAEIESIPELFLRGILQILIKEKILLAKEGRSGGVRLNLSPRRITLARLIDIFQDGVCVSDCVFRKSSCAHSLGCPLRPRLAAIEKRLAAEFKGITIADLLKATEGKP